MAYISVAFLASCFTYLQGGVVPRCLQGGVVPVAERKSCSWFAEAAQLGKALVAGVCSSYGVFGGILIAVLMAGIAGTLALLTDLNSEISLLPMA